MDRQSVFLLISLFTLSYKNGSYAEQSSENDDDSQIDSINCENDVDSEIDSINCTCKLNVDKDKDLFSHPSKPSIPYPLVINSLDLMQSSPTPCNLPVELPGGRTLLFNNVTQNFIETRFNETIELKITNGNLVFKFYNPGNQEIRTGRYSFGGHVIFALPTPSSSKKEVAKIEDLKCSAKTVKGRAIPSKIFTLCHEYNKFKGDPKHLIYPDQVNITINNDNELEFRTNSSETIIVGCHTGVTGRNSRSRRIYSLMLEPNCSQHNIMKPMQSPRAVNLAAILPALVSVVIIVIICILLKKQREKTSRTKFELDKYMAGPKIPSWATELLHPRGLLHCEEIIGQGGFGIVYKAQVNNLSEAGALIVAAKTHKLGSKQGHDDLMQEGKLLSGLEYHYNIINLLAISMDNTKDGSRLILILDFCPRGSLLGVLRKKKDGLKAQKEGGHRMEDDGLKAQNEGGHRQEDDGLKTKMEGETKDEDDVNAMVGWAFQIAEGMEFLSLNRVIHGDLAARNVLLDEDNNIKIGDFGKSHCVDYDNIGVEIEGAHPMLWMAPEALQNKSVSLETDVWSYGVTVWEIFSMGTHPYSDISIYNLLDEIKGGYRLPQPEKCPSRIYEEVILPCWSLSPIDRPSWSFFITLLSSMVGSKYLQDYSLVQAKNTKNYYTTRNYVKMNNNVSTLSSDK